MIRVLLQIVLPLVLPFLIYWGYLQLARSRARAAGRPETDLQVAEVPWTWLATAGVVLVLITMIGVGLLGGADPEAVYEPPRYEDGKIVPGRMRGE